MTCTLRLEGGHEASQRAVTITDQTGHGTRRWEFGRYRKGGARFGE